MKIKILLIWITLITGGSAVSAEENGKVQEKQDGLIVWSQDNRKWISPEEFFMSELIKLKGPTYGVVTEYPPYESVKEWETLIDKLPDERVCPMVFFHQRWRRLPDVLALDERLRNYGGCKDVFNF
jgi:hypothetical protein